MHTSWNKDIDNPYIQCTRCFDQVISNLVRNIYLKNNYLDDYEPWSDIPVDTPFMLLSMHHTTLQSTPIDIVSRHDMILNDPFIYDW